MRVWLLSHTSSRAPSQPGALACSQRTSPSVHDINSRQHPTAPHPIQRPIPYGTPSHTAPHPARHSPSVQRGCRHPTAPHPQPLMSYPIFLHNRRAGLPSWNKKFWLAEINPAVPAGQRAATLGSDLGSQTDSPPAAGRTELSDPRLSGDIHTGARNFRHLGEDTWGCLQEQGHSWDIAGADPVVPMAAAQQKDPTKLGVPHVC